jgi:dTDP-4-amino-4,6-dideoxygalactose transaminase
MTNKDRKKIWLSPPHLSGTEMEYVDRALADNWVAPVGPNIDSFESKLEKFVKNKRHVAALNSGTSALHLALILAGVSSGDEVICQSFTFAATAFPIVYQGAIPVFVDSEKDTWNMSPELLEKALEEIKNKSLPKAIIAVHLYGMPYKVDEIHEIAKWYDIPVIEDSAESLGSIYKGINCGALGDYGIYSFNGNKIITTSAGGALLCKSDQLKNDAIKKATQSREEMQHYEHHAVGYNYRMSNVLAGIGLGQFAVLEKRIEQRRAIFNRYYEALKNYFEFQMEPDGYLTNRWLTCILTNSEDQKELIIKELKEQRIEARPLWKPLHLQPLFKGNREFSNGVAEDMFMRGLCLPSGSSQSIEETDRIIEIIKSRL